MLHYSLININEDKEHCNSFGSYISSFATAIIIDLNLIFTLLCNTEETQCWNSEANASEYLVNYSSY